MSQLRNRSRAILACATLIVAVLLACVGCSDAINGKPTSILDNRVQQLHQRVESASNAEARYRAYWSDVCQTQRELKATQPIEADWEGDELSSRYFDVVVEYYFQLVDDNKLPDDAVARDGGRFIAGRDTCDFS